MMGIAGRAVSKGLSSGQYSNPTLLFLLLSLTFIQGRVIHREDQFIAAIYEHAAVDGDSEAAAVKANLDIYLEQVQKAYNQVKNLSLHCTVFAMLFLG